MMTLLATLASISACGNFDMDLHLPARPRQHLRTPREVEVLKAHEQSSHAAAFLGGQDVFFDTHNSLNRLEFADEMSTCVRPSASIYAKNRHHYLNGKDFMNLQGVWPEDLLRPEYFYQLCKEDDALARDLAGNAMTTTVSQVHFIAALIHSEGIRKLGR